MAQSKEVWVIPEIFPNGNEISKLSAGLLSEACYIADKIDGQVTALILGDQSADYSEALSLYGVGKAYYFKHPLLRRYSAEAYMVVLKEKLKSENPWMLILGQTTTGKELAPALAAGSGTGVVSGYARIDFSNPEKLRFYRPIYDGQAYQEVTFKSPGTMILTVDTQALNITPVKNKKETSVTTYEPLLSTENIQARHICYLPADYKTVDISEADVVIGTGMGILTAEVFPLIEELSTLIEGAVGSTRPVMDEGKLPRERMIGQTGKIISPQIYLALGISGATHHLGGIQDSKTIIAVNRDTQAPILQNADVGVVADLKVILPGLIEKIKQARKNGEIL